VDLSGVAQCKASGTEVVLPIDARDVACAAAALVAELRNEHGRNALLWTDLLSRLPRANPESFHDDAVSRVDRLRDRNAFIEAEARRILSTLDRPVLVARAGDLAATDAPAWSQLSGEISTLNGPAHAGWTFVRLDCASGAAASSVNRGREVLDEVFGGAAIADRFAVAVSSSWNGSVRACVASTLELAASGRLVWADGLVDITDTDPVLDAGSLVSDAATSIASPLAPWTEENSEDRVRAIEASLDAGEAAALQGNLSETLRACIRVHTWVDAASKPDSEHAIRLADLWSECGRSDAAEVVLRSASPLCSSVDVALRLARIAVSRGDEAQLSTMLEGLRRHDVAQAHVAEVARLNAVVLLLRRDLPRAQAVLTSALDDRSSATLRGRLWLLSTLGNVLRLRGRRFSARRVLRYVKLHASRAGSARLQVAASSNLVIALAGDAPPARMASEAWAIADRCFAWGMVHEGLVNALTATTYWIAVGESGMARRAVEEVLQRYAATEARMNTVFAELRRNHLAAMDMDEDWSGIQRAIEVDEDVARLREQSLHVRLICGELGVCANDAIARRVVARGCERDARSASLLARLVKRSRASSRSVRVTLRQLELSMDSWLPVIGHCARATVRSAGCSTALNEVLHVVRVEAKQRESVGAIAAALHASALAWAPTVDSESAAWFAANASADERRRPAGIRLWEWRLAVRRAAIESGAAEHDDQDAEAVLEEMESTVRRLWAEARIGYARSLPLGNVARLSGCEVSDEELRTTSDDPAAPFERLRSVLFRRRVREEHGGKRAAGLERVLRGALRLQSATDIDGLLGEIVAGVAAVCRAERAVVVYGGGRRHGRAKVAANGAVSSIAQSEAEVSLTAVARVRETKRACLIDDACGDERLGDRPSVMQYRPRSLIVAPLQTLGEFLGYIYVENRSAAKSFSSSDVELVEGFAAQAAFALENAQLVDELRRSCEELDRARSDAVRAESLRVVGRMASEVAHDFNNLLTAILGETQLLMQGDDVRDCAESLAVIERAALDGADVVRRMQATTRIKDPSAFVVLSLKDVVRNVMDMMRWRATSERVNVRCDVDAGLRVRGVPSELREVLTNLVVNALDAMSGGGELRIVGTPAGGDAVIDVEDTGHGMDARTAAQAFDPFFSTKGEKGNGLGLSIAYGIMQRHGGGIQVVSRVGSGTRMRLTMPLARDTISPAADGSQNCEESIARPQPARALVVDDEPAIARVLSTMLRRAGVDVEVSIGGLAGLASIRAQGADFDLVITDVNMPDVNGIEVAMAALKAERSARVVLMSGSLGGREEATAQALGFQVLRKPFTVKDIDRLVLGVS
jgi:signal transduction histidine kinase